MKLAALAAPEMDYNHPEKVDRVPEFSRALLESQLQGALLC